MYTLMLVLAIFAFVKQQPLYFEAWRWLGIKIGEKLNETGFLFIGVATGAATSAWGVEFGYAAATALISLVIAGLLLWMGFGVSWLFETNAGGWNGRTQRGKCRSC
jgi:hypothetical protein